MPWSDFERWRFKPWWTDATIDYGKRTVNVTVKVKIINLREYLAPSWSKILLFPGAAALQATLAAALSRAQDMEPDLFTRMARNVREGIAKHWSRDDLSGRYKVRVAPVDSDSDSAIIIVLAKALEANLPQGIGQRSFNLATFGEGLPTVDLYIVSRERRFTAEQLDNEMRYIGAHELGHSILRAMQGGGILYSLTHKGSSTVGQQVADSAPDYPSSGEVDVMLYYKGSEAPDTARYADTKASSSDVEGLVNMSVLPPWLPG